MAQVFISYRRTERDDARRLAEKLTDGGVSVGLNDMHAPGANLAEVLSQRIRAAGCVIVLWSRESAGSE